VRLIQDSAGFQDLPGSLHLAVGVFDGVHCGHAAVVGRAVARGGTAVVVTFDPHPSRVLSPGRAPDLLTTLEHKAKLVSQLGAGCLLVIPFDAARAGQEAGEFVAEIASLAKVESVTVGSGFRFGKGRLGDLALLEECGVEMGFTVEGVAPVVDARGDVVSSTRVRTALEEGNLLLVSELLGRDYSLYGNVFRGRELGRTIGFPTANIALRVEALPPVGVYAVRVGLDGTLLNGVANFGFRPTVERQRPEPLLEVHLLDFDEDIYGREIEVHFVASIRGEHRFEGIEALKKQIGKDAQRARELLA